MYLFKGKRVYNVEWKIAMVLGATKIGEVHAKKKSRVAIREETILTTIKKKK